MKDSGAHFMPSNDKIKMTKQEFDDLYEIETIEEPKAIEETKDDPEPEFLTEEEEEQDKKLFEELPLMEDTDA